MRTLPALGALVALLAAPVFSTPPASAQVPPQPVWTAVNMPLYFAYGGSPWQSQPPAAGPYNFYFPGQVPTPIPDQLSCYWNDYAPPFWYDGSVRKSGQVLKSEPAVGTVFAASLWPGQQFRGLSFLGAFAAGTYPAQSYLIGTVFWANNDCYAGTTEYGYFHDYTIDYTGFYWGLNQNCPDAGSLRCYSQDSPNSPLANGCSSGVTIPRLPKSDYQYYHNAFIFYDSTSGHYKFRAEIIDPNTWEIPWSCTMDPLAPDPFVNCPRVYSQNQCGTSFPTGSLYYNFGTVTAGISRDNFAGPSTAINAFQITTVKVAK